MKKEILDASGLRVEEMTPEEATKHETKELAISSARKRLDASKKQEKPILTPFNFEGETVWIRRLSYEDLITVALSIKRNGHNALNITNEGGAVAAWRISLLHIVANEDGTNYFEYEDACEFLSDATQASFVSALAVEIVRINPDLFATLKKTD